MTFIMQRSLAIASRPAALVEAMAREGTIIQTNDGFDETWIAVTQVEWKDQGCMLERTVWWFDEASRSWSVDGSSGWWMEAGVAHLLAEALQEPLPGVKA